MGYIVYRYIDTNTEIIKYIGISRDINTFNQRVQAHKRDNWFKNSNWRIEYLEVDNQSVAEAIESHLISLYHTDHWFNTAKSDWGINPYLPVEFNNWILYEEPKQEHTSKHRLTSKDASTEERKIYSWWCGMHNDRSDEFDDPYVFYQWVIHHPDYTVNRFPVKSDDSLKYSPSNLLFSERKQPIDNGRKKNITYNGETHSMTEWADILGCSKSLLSKRLKRGYSIERLLSMPRQYGRAMLEKDESIG